MANRISEESSRPATACQEDDTPAEKNGSQLWQMEGIDVAVGLEYAGEDEELYREILADYVDCAKEQEEAIERAAVGGDLETYTIEVHSLKSTSRTIGALALSDMAKELEFSGRNGERETIEARTPALLEAYRRICLSIMPYLFCAEPDVGKKPADQEAVNGLLSELAVCLDAFDAAGAEKITAELSDFDFSGEPAAYREKLASALRRFDYETCRGIVSQWRGGQ